MLTAVLVLLLAAPSCDLPRDADGRVIRDPQAKAAFRASNPCPRTHQTTGSCPGYVIDHICPLSCCGRDDPSNMQWQTTAEGKEKDGWEGDCSSCPGGPRAPKAAAAPRSKKSKASPEVTPAGAASGGCCKHCTNSCPCGDSCISCEKECHKPPGCACKDGS